MKQHRLWRFVAGSIVLVILFSAGFSTGHLSAAQEPPPTWFSNVLWYPSLEEAGLGIAELLNQIDAACAVDVDPVRSSNGAGADGPVYGFTVAWSCQPGVAAAGIDSWYSTMLWRPTIADTGLALSEVLNEIDGSCTVDADPVLASNGSGPEAPVYAFVVSWACRSGAPPASGPWLSNMVWQPTFAEAGIALAELLNQIEAGCTVDIDEAVTTNGASPDGPLVAFAASWSCPA
ncbi:MAG: hypothetical protein AB7V46_10590 [Thermomicrobiales bacterium]